MRWLAMVAVLLFGAMACDDDTSAPDGASVFVIDVEGQQFRVRVTEPATIAALQARRTSGQQGAILGSLVQGDGGYNQPWSWHLDPATVEAPDVAIEVCDGTPDMVEDDLDYWLNTVERYCPWGAKVIAVQ